MKLQVIGPSDLKLQVIRPSDLKLQVFGPSDLKLQVIGPSDLKQSKENGKTYRANLKIDFQTGVVATGCPWSVGGAMGKTHNNLITFLLSCRGGCLMT